MADESTLNPPSQETGRQIIDTYRDPIVGVLPFGTVCLFAGASGAGKTIMQTEWIRRWQLGKTIWHHETHCPRAFYYLAADRDWSTYQAALETADVDTRTVHHYCLPEDPLVNWGAWRTKPAFERLAYCLERLKPTPGSLLIIEPFVPLFISGNANNASDAALSLLHLRAVARKLQVTILASANIGKIRQDEGYVRPQDRIAGSGALIAFSDTQMYLYQGETPDHPHVFGWVPRRSIPREFKVRFDGETRLFRPDAGLFEPAKKLTTDERLSALVEMLPLDSPVERGDLEDRAEELLKVSRATIGRDLEKLKTQGLVEWAEYGKIRRRRPV